MKRKIKDFNDFLTCIKAGKKVIDGNGEMLYYFENGCICCKDKEGFVWYNTYVDTNDLSRIEVEEQEQFNIEVGKFYRTRDGSKAYCFYKDKEDKFFPNHFVIEGESGCETYKDDGSYFKDEESCFDIVAYWEEE